MKSIRWFGGLNNARGVRPRFVVLFVTTLAYALVAFAFASEYVQHFGASFEGGRAHVALVSMSWLVLALSLGIAGALAGEAAPFRRLCFVVLCGWNTVLVAYYAAAVGGLSLWGQIPTLTLLWAYADQIPALLSAMGESVWGAAVALVGCVAVLTGLSWSQSNALSHCLHFGRSVCVPTSKNQRLVAELMFIPLLLSAYGVWANFDPYVDRDVMWDEPLYLTVVEPTSTQVQSLPLDSAARVRRRNEEQRQRDMYVPARDYRKHNVVLITVDALRPDHLGVAGYQRATTPYLQQLKEKKLLHVGTEARAACAESACGLLSLLSGKQPHEILSTNFGLPDVLAIHGYRRVFLLSGDHTNFYRLRDSFGPAEIFHDGSTAGESYLNDDEALLKRISQLPNSDGTPHFFFFHLMSAHGSGTKHKSHEVWTPVRSLYRAKGMSDESIRQGVINSYDNGVHQADSSVRRILEMLRARGYVEDATLVLVTSDHGEGLGDHGIMSHAKSLHESVIRVPWLWIGANPQQSLHQPVVHADFAPTVLTYLNMPIPSHWSGRPLQTVIRERDTLHRQGDDVAIVRHRDQSVHKYIYNLRTRKELYFDLVNDRPEQFNLTTQLGSELRSGFREQFAKSGLVAVSGRHSDHDK